MIGKIIMTAALSAGLSMTVSADKIEKQMKMLSKPNKQLKKLAKAQKFKDPHFKKFANELIKKSEAFLKHKDEDEEFNELIVEYRKTLEALKAATAAGKHNSIKEAYDGVKQSCKKCHDIFKED